MNMKTFVPKQAIQKDVDLYAEITAGSTKDVARKVLELVPSLPPQAVIHDNGCGAGEVTSVIMETQSPAGISIEATDIDQTYLDRLSTLSRDRDWPVRITNMGADKLSFADDMFDLSVANFVVFLTPDGGVPALREMRRTLRSGGTAVLTAWARLPHVDPVAAAHAATRRLEGPRLREIPPEWWRGSHLKQVALEAGFAEEKTWLTTVTVYIAVADERHLAQVLWSYLGPPVTGWLPSDEQNWDRAINVILQSFGDTEGFERVDETGGMRIKLIANVLIARK